MNKTIDELFLDDWANPVFDGKDCIANAIRRIESRLSALENIIACDGIDARLHQPSAQPAETEREWIPCKGVTVRWPDGEIVTHTLACAISYEYGDKQPEPPKGDK